MLLVRRSVSSWHKELERHIVKCQGEVNEHQPRSLDLFLGNGVERTGSSQQTAWCSNTRLYIQNVQKDNLQSL